MTRNNKLCTRDVSYSVRVSLEWGSEAAWCVCYCMVCVPENVLRADITSPVRPRASQSRCRGAGVIVRYVAIEIYIENDFG